MNNLKGKCLCGEVNYRLNSEILNVVNCHCNFCRSHSGAAFSTYAVFPYASLEITGGKETLSNYEIEEGKKYFCSKCGTPIFNLNNKYPGICVIYYGTLENSREIMPKLNVWSENKLEWVDAMASILSLPQGTDRESTKNEL